MKNVIIGLALLFLFSCKKEETLSIYPIHVYSVYLGESTEPGYIDFEQDGVNDVKIESYASTATANIYLSITGLNGWEVAFENYTDSLYSWGLNDTITSSHDRCLPFYSGGVISGSYNFAANAYITYYINDQFNDHLNPDNEVIGSEVYYGFQNANKTAWIKMKIINTSSAEILDANFEAGSSITIP